MAEDPPLSYHTSQEESVRQAEAAFGGAAAETSLPEGPKAPTGVPGVRRRRFRPARLILPLLPVMLIGGVALGGYLLVKSAVDDATNPGATPSLPDIPGVPDLPNLPEVPTPPESPGQPTPPSASSSYLTVRGLARGKATAQRLAGRGARIQLARVTSDQLQVITRSGSTGKVLLVSPGVSRTVTTPGTRTGNEFGFESFNPVVVGRLVAALGRRHNLRASRIDYMVLLRNPVTKNVQWFIYPTGGGGHFEADARGGSLRRTG